MSIHLTAAGVSGGAIPSMFVAPIGCVNVGVFVAGSQGTIGIPDPSSGIVDTSGAFPSSTAPEAVLLTLRQDVRRQLDQFARSGKRHAAITVPRPEEMPVPFDSAARALAGAINVFAGGIAPAAFELAVGVPDDAALAMFREAFDVVGNSAAYLQTNFGTPAFAAAWDGIPVGSSNNEFFLRSANAFGIDYPRMLDLGTGTGKALRPAASRFPRGLAIGVDQAPEMLAFAERRFALLFPGWQRGFVRADVERLDATLPPELSNFDAATARFLFNFVDLPAVLPQVQRRLKPGGRLVFNVFSGFHLGYTEAFRKGNPFEEARIRVAKGVLEERLLPALTDAQRASLAAAGHIRRRPDGSWEILSEPVTQKRGLDLASLEAALSAAGFEDVSIEPVSESYSARAKFDSFRLTKSLPYWWDITNLIIDDIAFRLELVDEIERRMPAEFKTGEHLFTDVFVSARRPAGGAHSTPPPGDLPEKAFVRETAAELLASPESVSPERAKLFFDLIAAFPETFLDFHRRGLLSFGRTPPDGAYSGYGQEVVLEATRRNLYAFLEPILAHILREKPGALLLVDDGARPLAPLIGKFLEAFGLSLPVRFVRISAQSYGQDAVDAYRLLAPLKKDIAGQHVMIIDDNAVRLATGPALDRALQAAGAKRVSYGVLAAFNRKAAEYVDAAAVRLPGVSQWIDPLRGLVSWTEWENGRRAAASDMTSFEAEALASFTEELERHRERLLTLAASPAATPVRKPLSDDERVFLRFAAARAWTEEEFLIGALNGTIALSEPTKRLLGKYMQRRDAPQSQKPPPVARIVVATRDGRGRTTLDLATGLRLHSFARLYLRHGPAGFALPSDESVAHIRMSIAGEDAGFLRFASIPNADGSRSLVFERLDIDAGVDADPEELLAEALGVAQRLAAEGGYRELLIAGRDIAFSMNAGIRDAYNAVIKGRLNPASPLSTAREWKPHPLLAGTIDHIEGRAPLKVVPRN